MLFLHFGHGFIARVLLRELWGRLFILFLNLWRGRQIWLGFVRCRLRFGCDFGFRLCGRDWIWFGLILARFHLSTGFVSRFTRRSARRGSRLSTLWHGWLLFRLLILFHLCWLWGWLPSFGCRLLLLLFRVRYDDADAFLWWLQRTPIGLSSRSRRNLTSSGRGHVWFGLLLLLRDLLPFLGNSACGRFPRGGCTPNRSRNFLYVVAASTIFGFGFWRC